MEPLFPTKLPDLLHGEVWWQRSGSPVFQKLRGLATHACYPLGRTHIYVCYKYIYIERERDRATQSGLHLPPPPCAHSVPPPPSRGRSAASCEPPLAFAALPLAFAALRAGGTLLPFAAPQALASSARPRKSWVRIIPLTHRIERDLKTSLERRTSSSWCHGGWGFHCANEAWPSKTYPGGQGSSPLQSCHSFGLPAR